MTRFIRNATGKQVLYAFLLTNIIFLIMLMFSIPKVSSYAEGMQLFDMMPVGYDIDYASSLLNALGQEGRAVYLWQQIPLDLLYPGLFAISYFMVLAWFMKKMNLMKGAFRFLPWIAVLAGLFDYLENIGIIWMLNFFPEISTFSVQWSSTFSVLKSSFTTLYFVVLLSVMLVFLWRKWKGMAGTKLENRTS